MGIPQIQHSNQHADLFSSVLSAVLEYWFPSCNKLHADILIGSIFRLNVCAKFQLSGMGGVTSKGSLCACTKGKSCSQSTGDPLGKLQSMLLLLSMTVMGKFWEKYSFKCLGPRSQSTYRSNQHLKLIPETNRKQCKSLRI